MLLGRDHGCGPLTGIGVAGSLASSASEGVFCAAPRVPHSPTSCVHSASSDRKNMSSAIQKPNSATPWGCHTAQALAKRQRYFLENAGGSILWTHASQILQSL